MAAEVTVEPVIVATEVVVLAVVAVVKATVQVAVMVVKAAIVCRCQGPQCSFVRSHCSIAAGTVC